MTMAFEPAHQPVGAPGVAPAGCGALSAEALDRLQRAGLTVLERVGVEVRDEPSLGLLAKSGARVKGTRAHIPKELVDRAVSTVPGRFTLPGRASDGSLDLEVAPGSGLFGNGTDCLYFRDAASGERRRALLADVETIATACERLPNIDFVMSGVLPADAPLERVDLAQFAAMLKGTRKPLVIAPATAGETLPAMLEMAGRAGRCESFAVLGMSNPPLVLDGSCLGKARACGAAGVPFICGPANTLGATGPASVAGAIALGHAETLAVLVAHQLATPGAPFVYGVGAGSAFDMRTFVDVWMSPEGMLADAAAVQLATARGLPTWGYAACGDGKILDGQLATELAVTTLYAAQTGASLYHDVGELEAGVQNSLESLVLGDTLVGLARRLLAGITVDDEALQLDDIEAVGPGGSFLGRAYTRRHHRDVWSSPLFDTSTFDRWTEAGSHTFEERLHEAALDLMVGRESVVQEGVRAGLDAYWQRA
jgi:trimethylamine--corrinoid protein Co-methyltransferase